MNVVRVLHALQKPPDRRRKRDAVQSNARQRTGRSRMFGMTNDASVNALELLKRDHQQVDKLFK